MILPVYIVYAVCKAGCDALGVKVTAVFVKFIYKRTVSA